MLFSYAIEGFLGWDGWPEGWVDGLCVRHGWVCGMGGWCDGWPVRWVDGVMGLSVGFININDMYNNDVGKGVVYAYEAYEVK
jgi:hypothetical protein